MGFFPFPFDFSEDVHTTYHIYNSIKSQFDGIIEKTAERTYLKFIDNSIWLLRVLIQRFQRRERDIIASKESYIKVL